MRQCLSLLAVSGSNLQVVLSCAIRDVLTCRSKNDYTRPHLGRLRCGQGGVPDNITVFQKTNLARVDSGQFRVVQAKLFQSTEHNIKASVCRLTHFINLGITLEVILDIDTKNRLLIQHVEDSFHKTYIDGLAFIRVTFKKVAVGPLQESIQIRLLSEVHSRSV